MRIPFFCTAKELWDHPTYMDSVRSRVRMWYAQHMDKNRTTYLEDVSQDIVPVTYCCGHSDVFTTMCEERSPMNVLAAEEASVMLCDQCIIERWRAMPDKALEVFLTSISQHHAELRPSSRIFEGSYQSYLAYHVLKDRKPLDVMGHLTLMIQLDNDPASVHRILAEQENPTNHTTFSQRQAAYDFRCFTFPETLGEVEPTNFHFNPTKNNLMGSAVAGLLRKYPEKAKLFLCDPDPTIRRHAYLIYLTAEPQQAPLIHETTNDNWLKSYCKELMQGNAHD